MPGIDQASPMQSWRVGLTISFILAALLGVSCGNRETAFEPEIRPEPRTQPQAGRFAPTSATRTAPENFTVELSTTKGPVVIDIHRSWAPLGADRFYNLVMGGFFTDVAFFRVVPGFIVQFGIHGDPATARMWEHASIADDPATQSNRRGTLTFATAGPNTRTTQMFINLNDNANLDSMGFAPIGEVRDMAAVDAINSAHGERPSQGQIQAEGNRYLRANFQGLDFVERARVR